MMSRVWQLCVISVFAIVPLATSQGGDEPQAATPPPAAETRADAAASQPENQPKQRPAAAQWKPLEIRPDGRWVECRFGGDGPVEIKDGVISLGFGDPLTGVRWEGDFPRMDYEISLEARRTGGFDFFCGLTLPVGDQRCSLILGGWGGSLIGISSIDGLDASSNETMLIRHFEQDRWYKVRMQVTQTHLRAWLDDEKIVDWERDGRSLDIRGEMEETTPVGIAAFQCESEIRNVRIRRLTATPSNAKATGDAQDKNDAKDTSDAHDKSETAEDPTKRPSED